MKWFKFNELCLIGSIRYNPLTKKVSFANTEPKLSLFTFVFPLPETVSSTCRVLPTYLWNGWVKGRFAKTSRNNLGLSKKRYTNYFPLSHISLLLSPSTALQSQSLNLTIFQHFGSKDKAPMGICRDDGVREDFQARGHADLSSVNSIDRHSRMAASHDIQLFLSGKWQSSHCKNRTGSEMDKIYPS